MHISTNSPARSAVVFGASGQIGAALLQRLLAAGWQVHAVSRQARQDTAALQWLQGDLDNPPPLPARPDVVFSCGPLDAFARWYQRHALVGVRVIAFSSTSVLVKHTSPDPAERDLAVRLASAEHAVFAHARDQQADATILRPTLVWGAGMDRSLSRIAALARHWGWFVLPRSAQGARQPVHVDDLAAAALAVLDCRAAHGQNYALAGGQVLSYWQMVQRVLLALPRRPRLLPVPDWLFRALVVLARRSGLLHGFGSAVQARMAQDLVFDIEPARCDFGYAPRGFSPTPAELGLTQ